MTHATPPSRFQTAWCDAARGRRAECMSFEESATLRMFLMEDFERAKTWPGLIDRLEKKGFELSFQGDRLTLLNRHTGIALCTCRCLGFSFETLLRSFGKPTVIAGSCQLVSPHSAS